MKSFPSLDETIGAINWAKCEHCYGEGIEIPPLLRGAAAKTAGARKKAWEGLWSNLYHQDSTYSASYGSIPSLAALACNGTERDKLEAVLLAGAIDMWSSAARIRAIPRALLSQARARLLSIGRKLKKDRKFKKAEEKFLDQALLALSGERRKAIREYQREDEEEDEESEDDRELVMRVKYRRERGLIYYLDEDGDIGVRRPIKGGIRSEKVFTLGLVRKKGWAYQLDKDNIYRFRIGR